MYNKQRILFCSILVVGLLLSACSNFLDIPGLIDNNSTGNVSIIIGGDTNARTILPSQLDDLGKLHFVLTFTRTGYETVTRTRSPGNTGAVTLDLDVGTWNLSVMGFVNAPGDTPMETNALVRATTQSINVQAGVTNTFPVELTLNEGNMTKNGEGILRYAITLPAGANGNMEVYELDITGGALIEESDPTENIPLSAGVTNNGNLTLDSGFYNIYVNLSGGTNQATSWTELVHIYDNAISVVEKSFANITWNPLSGTITGFSFLDADYYPDVHISHENGTISIVVHSGTNIASLTPEITHTGIMISPAPLPNMNFTNPVAFTIYAENGFEKTYTVTVAESNYDIALSTGDHTFDALQYGAAVSALPVVVSNTGNRNTGELTVALSGTNAGSFTLSATTLAGIAIDGTGNFTVTPNANLPVVNNANTTYTATVTVSGANGISEEFDISFTVLPITISETEITVVEPAIRGTPASTATVPSNANYTFTSIEWNPNEDPFGGGVEYTVTIVLQANDNYAFIAAATATVNDETATVTSSTNSTLILTYTFDATISFAVISLDMDDFEMTDQDVYTATPITLNSTNSILKVELPVGINNALWTIGNINMGDGNSINLDHSQFNPDVYTLTVSFEYDDKPWLVNITLTVE